MLIGIVLSTIVIFMSAQAATLVEPSVNPNPALAAKTTGDAAQGRILFVAKGCIVCHNNDRIAENRSLRAQISPDSPNLSSVKIDPDYLRRWLKDPKDMKPSTEMPNLDLSEVEIESLVAFVVASTESQQ
jgi:cytochrome c2